MKSYVFDVGIDGISWVNQEKGPCIYIDDCFYLPKDGWSDETKLRALLVITECDPSEIRTYNVTDWVPRDYSEYARQCGDELLGTFEKNGEKFVVCRALPATAAPVSVSTEAGQKAVNSP